MFEFVILTIIGSSVLMVLTGLWAYRKLSGPQVFQRAIPNLSHNVRPVRRKSQQGYINLFSSLMIKKKKTVKSKSGKVYKAPWGW